MVRLSAKAKISAVFYFVAKIIFSNYAVRQKVIIANPVSTFRPCIIIIITLRTIDVLSSFQDHAPTQTIHDFHLACSTWVCRCRPDGGRPQATTEESYCQQEMRVTV
jgi:hypothetical protein